jgi:hypothetical protein
VTAVTVTSTIRDTVNYWFCPKANEDITGLGVTVPPIIYGWFAENSDGSASTLTVVLDSSYSWDVELTFPNAPPVIFSGFHPGNGDLLTQLSAQGWVPL